jgi:elongation factor Ts
MPEITATLVKELRDKTAAGMMDCKAALVEAGGDFDAAIDVLRRKGLQQADKKLGREANEGLIGVHVYADGSSGNIVEVNCETDFVARNENFMGLVQKLAHWVGMDSMAEIPRVSATVGENIVLRRWDCLVARVNDDGVQDTDIYSYVHTNGRIGVLVEMEGGSNIDYEVGRNVALQIAATNPLFVTRDEVDPALVEKETAFLLTQPDVAAKPENIRPKMIQGMLNKFYSAICLNEQQFVKDQTQTVGAYLVFHGSKVIRFIRFELGEDVGQV